MNKQEIKNFSKSAISIIIGFLISYIIIKLLTTNVGQIYKAILFEPLISPIMREKTILLWFILIIVALSMAFGLKAKLFNIGIPGQMLAGALPSTVLAITVFKNGFILAWPILLLVGIIGGALFGSIAGYLKARFKIHEVVSTIMLNWIIFFIGKEVFNKPAFKEGGFPGSKLWPMAAKTPLIATAIISIILAIVVFYIFARTKLGYKISMVGNQPSAADYSGISKEKIQTLTLAISGGFAGLAGAIYYGTYTGQYTIPLFDGLDTIGFDAIVVSLVAFNNPIAIIFISFVFAVIKVGGYSASIFFPYSAQLISLTMGIILYCIASSEVIKFKIKNKGGKK